MSASGKEVYCLCIDLIGSTAFGLELNKRQLDLFNRALVSQLNPHIKSVGLEETLVKFTGDGWLVISDDVDLLPSLCCLGLIMSEKFQAEIAAFTGLEQDRIPKLRIAICFGRDVKVELPDGRTDWVGDSARRATRAADYCSPNEILIDETVRNIVFRDFVTERFDHKNSSFQPKRVEEEFSLYRLSAIKDATAADTASPEYFINTLEIIGKHREAVNWAETAAEYLAEEAQKPRLDQELLLLKWNRLLGSKINYLTAKEIFEDILSAELQPDVYTYNILMGKSRNSVEAEKWLERMREENILPDVVTYSTLINLAPDYREAQEWMERMRKENILPDVVTYTTLINLAPDYHEAEKWMEQMREEDVPPNIVTYNTLINLAPDYDEAEKWMEWMREDNILPNVVTYNTLINLAPDYDEAEKWMERMREENIPPDIFTYNTLINLAPDYDEAKKWMERMRKDNIPPDVVTYNTLINLAPHYNEAKKWLERMREENIPPDVVTYSTLIILAPDYEKAKTLMDRMNQEEIVPNIITYGNLFSKDLTSVDAESILTWFLCQKYRYPHSIEGAIASYRRVHRIDQALRLILDYPYMDASLKVMRAHPDESIDFFLDQHKNSERKPNAAYALGIALTELGRNGEAREFLEQAFDLAVDEKRREDIKKRLEKHRP
jgi:pentatricopeptide repeat protein